MIETTSGSVVEDRTEFTSMSGIKPFDPRPFLELRVWAATYARIQRDRIALNNGLRSEAIPRDVVSEIVENYVNSEKMVGLAMRRSFRRAAPEVQAWLKTDAAVGIGEHLAARLLGTIGHPVHAQPHHWQGDGAERVLVADEPFDRNVAKLWAYCGVGDPTRKRRAGMTVEDATALGNPRAKMLVRLIAEGCIKCVGSAISTPIPVESARADAIDLPAPVLLTATNTESAPVNDLPGPASLTPAAGISVPGLVDDTTDDDIESATTIKVPRRRSPYRDVYDDGRRRYAQRDGWTLMHQHNAALRLVSKEVLRDLWLITRNHEEQIEPS